MKVRLVDIAHARSGDKGDTANVGLIALKPVWYDVIARQVTRLTNMLNEILDFTGGGQNTLALVSPRGHAMS